MKYYQLKDTNKMPGSFVVYYNTDNLKKDYPNEEFQEYSDGDIEACRFIDLTPAQILKEKPIMTYLTECLTNNNIDELQSFLDINKIELKTFFIRLGFKCTDENHHQWVKTEDHDYYQIFNDDYLFQFYLSKMDKNELESYVKDYYEGGIKEVEETHKTKESINLILAEIVAESLS